MDDKNDLNGVINYFLMYLAWFLSLIVGAFNAKYNFYDFSLVLYPILVIMFLLAIFTSYIFKKGFMHRVLLLLVSLVYGVVLGNVMSYGFYLM